MAVSALCSSINSTCKDGFVVAFPPLRLVASRKLAAVLVRTGSPGLLPPDISYVALGTGKWPGDVALRIDRGVPCIAYWFWIVSAQSGLPVSVYPFPEGGLTTPFSIVSAAGTAPHGQCVASRVAFVTCIDTPE
jgi:hypothetical protein